MIRMDQQTERRKQLLQEAAVQVVLLAVIVCLGFLFYNVFIHYTAERIAMTGQTVDTKILMPSKAEADWIYADAKGESNSIAIESEAEYAQLFRVSFQEYYLALKRDAKTNNLETVNRGSKVSIDMEKPETWKQAVAKEQTLDKEGRIYLPQKVYEAGGAAVLEKGLTESDPQESDQVDPLAYIEIQFSNRLFEAGDAPQDKEPYWFYEDGYCYYSEPVAGGETTLALLSKTIILKDLPEDLRGGVYRVSVQVEASEVSAEVLKEWSLDEKSAVYQQIEKIVKDAEDKELEKDGQ